MLSSFQEYILRIPIVLMAITIHEYAHGYAALKMGDTTAKNQGRLSLNPLAHMDPIGALCMLLFHFGWAKPVPINPYNFRDRKKGTMLVSIAGPLSNLFLSLVGAVILGILSRFRFSVESAIFVNLLVGIFGQMIILNISFAVFNLIPLPPLDGSKILGALLPAKYYFKLLQYERYAFPVLILLMVTGVLNRILSFFIIPLYNGLYNIVFLIGGI